MIECDNQMYYEKTKNYCSVLNTLIHENLGFIFLII